MSDTEQKPSGNSNLSFHVRSYYFQFIVFILFSYIFPRVINRQVLNDNVFI